MTINFNFYVLLALGILCTGLARSAEFIDDFSEAELAGRSVARGDWRFQDKSATATSDPELYKKFKNHGPIIKWPQEFVDGTIEFSIKAEKCQRVVFTLNGQGHIFRVTLADETETASAGASKEPTRIISWATQSSKENKGDSNRPKGMPDLPAIEGKWTKVKLVVKAGKGALKIGDFKTTLKHAALGRDKNLIMITFAHGSLSIRDFKFSSEGS